MAGEPCASRALRDEYIADSIPQIDFRIQRTF
jgi:hypothetical protein